MPSSCTWDPVQILSKVYYFYSTDKHITTVKIGSLFVFMSSLFKFFSGFEVCNIHVKF